MTDTSQQDRKAKAQYIADKIRELREAAGWSQSELSRRAGITAAAVSQIEKGDRIPSMVVAGKLGEALNVSVSELTGHVIPSSTEINGRAQAFFRSYGDIEELSEEDQTLIKNIVRSMKEKKK